MQDRADQNALTRTDGPAEADPQATVSAGDLRTCDPGDTRPEQDGVSRGRGNGKPRLPAPLQYRDPERYEILAEHGRGGLGYVLRARDRELGRSVAIKELLEHTTSSELRFFREALITARLEHPGIVPVHEAGRWPDGTPFYAMKLVAGRPLRELIEAARTLPERIALIPHIVAVADAIAYAHSKDIIHRDLKPANVIVGDFGETVVIDWGLAKNIHATESADDLAGNSEGSTGQITKLGTVLGTPAFMSPEQASGRASKQSDIYSVGMILCNALTGRLPISSSPDRSSLLAPLIPRGVPADLVAIIRCAMGIHSQPYASMDELAEDLRRFLRGDNVSARKYRLLHRTVRRALRNRLAFGTAIAAIAAIFALLVVGIVIVQGKNTRVTRAEQQARTEQRRTEDSLAQLTIAHAKALLGTDPTEAIRVLADRTDSEASFLRAEAVGRGVAVHAIRPHGDTVQFAVGAADGRLVTSSWDTTISTIAPATGAATKVASQLSPAVMPAYSTRTNQLAFLAEARLTLLDLTTMRETAIDGAVAELTRLRFSPDGSQLLALHRDGTIDLYDTSSSHDRPRVIRAPSETVFVAATRNGVVTASSTEVALRSTGQSAPVARLRVTAPATTVAANQDSSLLALGSTTGAVELVAIDGSTLLRHGHHDQLCIGPVLGVQVFAHRHLLYSCSDSTAGLVDLATGRTSRRFALDSSGGNLAFDDGGRWAAIGTQNGTLHVIETATGILHSFRGHGAPIIGIATPTPTFPFFASGDTKGQVRVWTPPHVKTATMTEGGDWIRALNFSRDLRHVAVALGARIALWNLDSGRCRFLEGHTAGVHRLTFSPDSQLVVSAAYDGTVRVWDTDVPGRGDIMSLHREGIGDIAVTPTGQILSAGYDGRLIRWTPLANPRREETLYTDSSVFSGVEYVAATHTIAVAREDGSVILVPEGKPPEPLTGDLASCGMWASYTQPWMAMGSCDGKVTRYDVGKKVLEPVMDIQSPLRHVVVSNDSSLIAASSTEGRLVVYDVNASREILSVPDLPTRVIMFTRRSPSLLATTGPSGDVRFYSFEKRAWTSLRLHSAVVNLGMFSHDDTLFATGDGSGTSRLIDVQSVFAPSSAATHILPALESCSLH